MTLSMMQEMAIRDCNGNCRCPYCGKYRKRSEFPDQPGHLGWDNEYGAGHIHVAPACAYCYEDESEAQ